MKGKVTFVNPPKEGKKMGNVKIGDKTIFFYPNQFSPVKGEAEVEYEDKDDTGEKPFYVMTGFTSLAKAEKKAEMQDEIKAGIPMKDVSAQNSILLSYSKDVLCALIAAGDEDAIKTPMSKLAYLYEAVILISNHTYKEPF